ncbi:substrate-binding periplasmic protein [Aeromonas dhakensis]|uniref:substrate-binding periplasmic protein n=1 Tax=Aeromonas dhakensis TaxID=196024 RepID=UPI001F61A194|nr:transporter substrate-binding domain-containing protein [Aeromonas dhakensis]UNU87253.1 transporter substrate-binding domain-containing protein [Aeromonas dhakensis]
MRRGFFGCLLLLSCLGTAQAELGKLEYLTEEYPPYNFTDAAGQPAGLAVELLQRIWQSTQTPPQPIRILPWARGYYLLTQKPNVVLFSTARTDTRDPLFKWACPIGHAEYVLLAYKRRPITLSAVEQINDYRISAVRSDASEQLLLNRGMDENRIIPANRLSQGLKMLVSGRADLLATGKLAGYDAIKELQLDAKAFTVAFVLDAEELCYAFSRQVDDGVIKQFQRALNQALASPDYQALRRQYMP